MCTYGKITANCPWAATINYTAYVFGGVPYPTRFGDVTHFLRPVDFRYDGSTTVLLVPKGGSLEVPRQQGRGPLRVYVAPLRFDDVHRDIDSLARAYPNVIVVAFDPRDEVQARTDNFRRKFGPTRAETTVALEILNGDGRDASAARIGVTAATVRTHLTHIFEKTAVHRQAELVRLLMSMKSV